MAIISCPNCQGKLRFPDDSPPRRVKCASCGNSFMAGPKGPIQEKAAAPAANRPEPPKAPARQEDDVVEDFEVVDDDKPSSSRQRDDDENDRPRSKRRDDDDDDKPRSKRRDDDDDDKPRSKRRDDDDDRPRSKQRDDDDDKPRSKRRDDDDDDRPRSKRRDDDDDDRPRSKRRGRDDDDDDDDRPRSKRRGRDDDDDDDYRDEKYERARKREEAALFHRTHLAINLIGIGFWCQVGALGLLFLIIPFLGVLCGEYSLSGDLLPLAGLPGMATWIVAAVGFGFLIAGVKKGNLLGLTIALAAVSGIHLILVFVISFSKEYSPLAGATGVGSISWSQMPTQLITLVAFLGSSRFITIVFLTALLEVARYILFVLVVKEVARICKDRALDKSSMVMIILMPSALGATLLIALLINLIQKEAGGGTAIYLITSILIYGAFITVCVMTALLCGKAKEAITYRKSK
jgi:hypothetical protein